jgi:hypothetical protein
MTETNPTRTVRRGRLYPERTMSQEEINQWHAEREAFRQRCKVVFDRVKPELIETHYNWYMAVEPDSGDYFIHKDELAVAKIAHQKHLNARLHVFRINETRICGTI